MLIILLVCRLIGRYIEPLNNSVFKRGIMFGDVVFMYIVMLIVAGLAFSPLGYFIYMYSRKDAEPFGDTEPHGDSESMVLDMAEQAINVVKGLLGKK